MAVASYKVARRRAKGNPLMRLLLPSGNWGLFFTVPWWFHTVTSLSFRPYFLRWFFRHWWGAPWILEDPQSLQDCNRLEWVSSWGKPREKKACDPSSLKSVESKCWKMDQKCCISIPRCRDSKTKWWSQVYWLSSKDAETWAPLPLFPPPKKGPQIVKPFSPELLGQQTQTQNVTKNITKFSISSDVGMVLLHGKGASSKSERPR